MFKLIKFKYYLVKLKKYEYVKFQSFVLIVLIIIISRKRPDNKLTYKMATKLFLLTSYDMISHHMVHGLLDEV